MRRMPLMMFVLLVLLPVAGAAQPAGTTDIPRTSWGRPALTGVWTNSSLTPLERPDEYGDRSSIRRTSWSSCSGPPSSGASTRSAGRKPSWPSSSARSGWSRER